MQRNKRRQKCFVTRLPYRRRWGDEKRVSGSQMCHRILITILWPSIPFCHPAVRLYTQPWILSCLWAGIQATFPLYLPSTDAIKRIFLSPWIRGSGSIAPSSFTPVSCKLRFYVREDLTIESRTPRAYFPSRVCYDRVTSSLLLLFLPMTITTCWLKVKNWIFFAESCFMSVWI